jgi:predicted acetyltransferase
MGRMALSLRDARTSAQDSLWLRNVLPFYLHELSGFGSEFWWLDETGRWQPEQAVETWFTRPDVSALLLLSEGKRIGFALVGHSPFPYMSAEVDHSLAEFFILAAHRRHGLGAEAARRVLQRFPGRWELEVLALNAPAQRFWRKVTRELPGLQVAPGHGLERFTFTVPPVAP